MCVVTKRFGGFSISRGLEIKEQGDGERVPKPLIYLRSKFELSLLKIYFNKWVKKYVCSKLAKSVILSLVCATHLSVSRSRLLVQVSC